MAQMPFQKRPNDLFVSYGHADKSRVDPIVGWLKHAAGLKVWYDEVSGDASKRSSALLANGIKSARGALFFLSSNWQASTWCQDEHEFALTERRSNSAYLVVAVQIDGMDLDLPDWFKVADVIDFHQFDARSGAALLRSLVPNPPVRVDNDQDIYFAGPWSRLNNAAKSVQRSLHAMGWRLVGDSPDLPHFQDALTRITSIVSTSRGLVAVLPFDKTRPPNNTSPYIMEEVRIALVCERPYLLVLVLRDFPHW